MKLPTLDHFRSDALKAGFTEGGFEQLLLEACVHDRHNPTHHDILMVMTAMDWAASCMDGVEVYNRRATGVRHPGTEGLSAQDLAN